jgi:PAS domain S-box-containing protein
MKAPLPADEAERLRSLRACRILDTPPEPAFDDIARLAALLCGTPVALVTFIDGERQWFKAHVGLDLTETHRDLAFCAHCILQRDVMVVPDAREDARFADNPLVKGPPGFRFYAGVPLIDEEGHALGTVAVVDFRPRELGKVQRDGLEVLARLILRQLELRRKTREYADRNDRYMQDMLDVLECSTDAIVAMDRDWRCTHANAAAARLSGRGVDELIGRDLRREFPEWADGAFHQACVRAMAGGPPEVVEEYFPTLERWLENRVYPASTGLIIYGRDITARRRSEEAILASRSQLAATLAAIPDMLFEIGLDGRFFDYRASRTELLAAPPEQFLGRRIAEVLPPDAAAACYAALNEAHERGRSEGWQYDLALPPGRRWFELSVARKPVPSGEEPRFVVLARDITARKEAELKLRDSEENLAITLQSIGDAVIATDAAGCITRMNTAAERLTAWPLPEALGRPLGEVFRIVHSETRVPAPNPVDEVLATGRTVGLANHTVLLGRDGAEYPVADSAAPIRDAAGGIVGAVLVFSDVSARYRAQEALRENEQRLRTIIETEPVCVKVVTADGRLVEMNRAGLAMLEASSLEEVQRHGLLHFIAPEYRAAFRELHRRVMQGESGTLEFSITGLRGTVRWLATHAAPMRDAAGGIAFLLGITRDITARREAEERVRHLASFAELNPNAVIEFDRDGAIGYRNPAALALARKAGGDWPSLLPPEAAGIVAECRATGRPNLGLQSMHGDCTFSWAFYPVEAGGAVHAYVSDITERLQLEEQFRQAQKMEAIGRLSGGVAHDFNNLLTVIQSVVASMQLDEPAVRRFEEPLRQIADAADRAANLTRQLLAFSRRQTMQLADLDLNDVITDMARMLRSIRGEDIEMRLQCAPQPLPLRADAGMVQQILLNLVVNARDAMPGGGCLSIETSETRFGEEDRRREPAVRPGRFICLAVGDTGAGIPREILPRIFEPFFTTKEVGKGTGLGLSTVYGIMQQHEGFVRVESVVGRGSTFRAYFPRRETMSRPVVAAKGAPPRLTGSETLLLVEDEPEVRTALRLGLLRFGYRVIEAESGPDALRIWEGCRDEINLVVTDLVMPGGMSGIDLGRRLQRERPDLPVIYTSGYSEEIAGRDVGLKAGENFLSKPFDLASLAGAVRAQLDALRPPAGPAE